MFDSSGALIIFIWESPKTIRKIKLVRLYQLITNLEFDSYVRVFNVIVYIGLTSMPLFSMYVQSSLSSYIFLGLLDHVFSPTVLYLRMLDVFLHFLLNFSFFVYLQVSPFAPCSSSDTWE